MNSATLINQSSENTEYYTPEYIVEAARWVLGGIDYDPASSKRANEIVKATGFSSAPGFEVVGELGGLPIRHYHHKDGGLGRLFFGRVWMNHPFGRPENECSLSCKKKKCVERGYHLGNDYPGNESWINQMVRSYTTGTMRHGLMICFASTSESWFDPLLDYPKCWIKKRVNYLDPETLEPIRGATKGSVVTYFGENIELFYKGFKALGSVHVPYSLMSGGF